jgi:hypothetical protein
VQQDDERAAAGLDVVQGHIADLGEALAELAAGLLTCRGDRVCECGVHDDLLSRTVFV